MGILAVAEVEACGWGCLGFMSKDGDGWGLVLGSWLSIMMRFRDGVAQDETEINLYIKFGKYFYIITNNVSKVKITTTFDYYYLIPLLRKPVQRLNLRLLSVTTSNNKEHWNRYLISFKVLIREGAANVPTNHRKEEQCLARHNQTRVR